MGTVCLYIEELPVYFSKYSILYSYMQCMKALIPLVSHRYLKKDLFFVAKFEGQDHEPLPLSSKFYSFWLILRFQSSFPHFVLFSGCRIITEDTSL